MNFFQLHPLWTTVGILALIVIAFKWASYELKHAIPEPQQRFDSKVVDLYSIEKKEIKDRLDHHEEAISN
jgi:hypothetical protein